MEFNKNTNGYSAAQLANGTLTVFFLNLDDKYCSLLLRLMEGVLAGLNEHPLRNYRNVPMVLKAD
jgi:hypothetical protein